MSDDQSQDKTLEPTERKKSQAREKGQIPKSRDLNTAIIMLAGVFMIMFFSKHLLDCLTDIMQIAFSQAYHQSQDLSSIGAIGKSFLIKTLWALAPFFIIMYACAWVGPALISGIHFMPQGMKMKAERLNLFKGLKRLFSLHSVVELVKSVGKFFIILGVAGITLYHLLDKLLMLSVIPLEQGMLGSFEIIRIATIFITGSLLIFAGIDVPYQLWENNRKMRMTPQELKEEMKDTDGNPEVKQLLRRKQQHLARQRMMIEIPKATVIITNPDHYAIALKYEKDSNGAPQLVAKGVDWMAENIKQIAQQHRIPIVSSPPLARAIYYSTDLFEEIPGGLYQAVAKILAYVYQLKAYNAGTGAKPVEPTELTIPDKLRRDHHG